MLKEFVWNAFLNTGSLDAYIFLKELESNEKLHNEKKITEDEVAISN